MSMTMVLRDSAVLVAGVGLCAGAFFVLEGTLGRRDRRTVGRPLERASTNEPPASEDAAAPPTALHPPGGPPPQSRAVDDDVLVGRIRAKLDRVVPELGAIDVDASDGLVMLRGSLRPADTHRVLRAVIRVGGVREVVNALDAHAASELNAGPDPFQISESGMLPNGGGPRASRARLVFGAAGTALAGYGAARRDVRGALLVAAGISLLARSVTRQATRAIADSRPDTRSVSPA